VTEQPPKKSGRRVTRRVHTIDRVAETVISTGGFLVLVAVLGICVYLAAVVVPLFSPGTVGERHQVSGVVPVGDVVLDPYQRAFAVIDAAGGVRVMAAADGQELAAPRGEAPHSPVTSLSVARNGDLVATGHADGSVRVGSIRFGASTVETDPGRGVGEVWIQDGAVLEVTDAGRARRSELVVDLGKPIDLKTGSGPVVRLDYTIDPTGKTALLAVREDGSVLVNSVRTVRPLGGGAPTVRLTTVAFQIAATEIPRWAFVTADAAQVFLVDEDGGLRRYSRAGSEFSLAETVRGVPEGQRVTAASMLLGAQSLLIGDDEGTVRSWHVAGIADADRPDAVRLYMAHEFAGSTGPILDMSPSTRDRSLVILGENGSVRVRHTTSEKIIADFESGLDSPGAARLWPKNDGVLVLGRGGGFVSRELEPGYPEFSVKALFGKVHYEGQAEPSYVYQSSSGDDASEVKLSVVPLIFGTLKATVVAMLFAVPMGILAAVYTSEFLSHKVRRWVKPGVEMMASLPSVVLGFVAAIIVAPFVRQWLPTVLVGLATVPVAVLLVAHLWQVVPMQVRKRMRSGQHILLVLAAVLLGVGLAVLMGRPFERLFFSPPDGLAPGMRVDMRRWLSGEYGAAWPGWVMVLAGPSAVLAAVVNSVFLRRRIDRIAGGLSVGGSALLVLGRFLVLLGLSIGLAFLGAYVLQGMGFDPRDSIFGEFSPRNTLVVAMIMGFAVIPIIYTISEDSLQAVPNTLRAASLGAGATPWQTAVRIVLPVAASGIFSACMIGFGRAAGETMIVLMATGNTPEMSWNIFGGFRTLAANIAVELPEAPKGETHYRVLFLCGLVLFLMTFVINTSAELIRQAVRARTAGL
jgi:phosphate transport system permease protein